MGESDTNSPSQASLQASAEENLRKNEHWERQARKKTAMLNDEMPAGELAVARGLKWLKEHQYKNGAWNFDHRAAPPV